MKRILLSLSFMLAVGLTMAIADNKTDINSKTKLSFKTEFTGVQLVHWDTVGNYQIARFTFHDHATIAYFSKDGELLGSARSILFDELPLAVIKSFEEKFAEGDFTDILEIFNSDGTFYSTTVTTMNKRYHVKVDADGSVVKSFRIK
jgi:hypothetical protein